MWETNQVLPVHELSFHIIQFSQAHTGDDELSHIPLNTFQVINYDYVG